jgi:Mn2+/Fe2+ NRAMP family transporter
LTIDQGLFVMTVTESNTVEQMILDAAANLGGTPAPVLHWNTRLAELAL